MRKFLFVICALAMPCASWAQNSRSSWANLSALQAGQGIQIVQMNSKKHSGSFVSASDTAISYRDAGGEQTIQKPDVRTVKLSKNTHRLRNTLIGGAVGAGVGAASVAGVWENSGFVGGKGTGAAIGAGLGFLVGAAVGALIPTHSTIYNAAVH
jgi:hypothetical protein